MFGNRGREREYKIEWIWTVLKSFLLYVWQSHRILSCMLHAQRERGRERCWRRCFFLFFLRRQWLIWLIKSKVKRSFMLDKVLNVKEKKNSWSIHVHVRISKRTRKKINDLVRNQKMDVTDLTDWNIARAQNKSARGARIYTQFIYSVINNN